MKTLLLISVLATLTLSNNAFAQDDNGQRYKAWFEGQDTNGDGQISRDESTGLMKRFFDRNDADKNGFLDAKELKQLAQRLAKNSGNRARNRTRNQRSYASDAKIREQVPDGVKVELNIAYREGNEAWRLDLAEPKQASSSPRPAIVFVHGGGWAGGDKRAANFIGPAIQYAAKGYVTISVNYRLDRDILPCVQDVKCAVRWLRAHSKKYNIDPKRIGAYGNSAGAHLVTMLGLSHSESKLEGDGPWREFSSGVQAVVASATPTLPTFGSASNEVKKLVAPMTYVSAVSPPMLLFHDQGDRTVPVANSDGFVEALKKAGAKDITYKRYNNKSGHGVFGRNAKETTPLMEAFFARTLKTTPLE